MLLLKSSRFCGFKYVITLVFQSNTRPFYSSKAKPVALCCLLPFVAYLPRFLGSPLSFFCFSSVDLLSFRLAHCCQFSQFLQQKMDRSDRHLPEAHRRSTGQPIGYLKKKNSEKQMHKFGGLFCILCSFREGLLRIRDLTKRWLTT